MDKMTKDISNDYKRLSNYFLAYSLESFIILMFVPFVVFATKVAENNYYRKKHRWILQILISYLITVSAIVISIFII